MRRLATILVLLVLGVVGFGAGTTAAATFYGYAGPGEWFSPGEGHGSPYDNWCDRWIENDFSKASTAYGLITFIDTTGGWSYTRQGYGWLSRAPSSFGWTKKLHCKNNAGSTYQGGCFGFFDLYGCA